MGVDGGGVRLHPLRELVGVETNVVTDPRRKSLVDRSRLGLQERVGLYRLRITLLGDEVSLDGVASRESGVVAPGLDQVQRRDVAVVLGLEPSEREAHGLEVAGQHVGDAVFGADDLDPFGNRGVGCRVGGDGQRDE